MYGLETSARRNNRGSAANVAALARGVLLILLTVVATPRARAEVIVFHDDFENGNANAWTASQTPGEGVNGAWVIGDPNGTIYEVPPQPAQQAQPEDAYAGTGCAFTAQNTSTGVHDVDNGEVYFTSRSIDLSTASAARLEYVRWFFNSTLNNDSGDFFVVQARPDPASPWVDVERLDDSQSANSWTPRTAQLESYVALTATVQIRFVAADQHLNPGDIVEAAIDEVRVIASGGCVTNADCPVGECCAGDGSCVPYGDGDYDGDGDVDLVDSGAFLACFGQDGVGACQAGNLVGDIGIAADDYAAFAAAMLGPQ